jgi:hypothetical protein
MPRRAALLVSLTILCLTSLAYAALPPGEFLLPDVPISTVRGATIDLKKYRGKALVVALISTQCPDCGLMVDLLNTLQEENGARGLQVVVAAGDEHAAANLPGFEIQHRPKFPLGYLDQASFLKLTHLRPGDHPSVPMVMFVDPTGMVRVEMQNNDPLMKKRDLTVRSTIRELLKEPGIKP